MNWLARMMYGRYGMDQLGMALMVLSLICTFLSACLSHGAAASAFYLLSTVLLAVILVRMLSRNIPRRYQENQVFLAKTAPLRSWFSQTKARLRDSRTHRHFQCPYCKQKVRVPKGRGKVCITCPQCRREFIKKT